MTDKNKHKFLSDDYKAWGKFAYQILYIAIVFVGSGTAITILGLRVQLQTSMIDIGITVIAIGIIIFVWGMRKQEKELSK